MVAEHADRGSRAALKMLQDQDREYAYVVSPAQQFLGVVSAESLRSALAGHQGPLGLAHAYLPAVQPIVADEPVSELFGRVDLALAAYNAGEGAVQRAGNQIPAFKETQNYVRTVLALYHQLKPPAPVQAHRAAPGRVRMQLQGGAHNRGNLPPDTVVAQSRASHEPLPTIPNE